jgi:hypothetical protein
MTGHLGDFSKKSRKSHNSFPIALFLVLSSPIYSAEKKELSFKEAIVFGKLPSTAIPLENGIDYHSVLITPKEENEVSLVKNEILFSDLKASSFFYKNTSLKIIDQVEKWYSSLASDKSSSPFHFSYEIPSPVLKIQEQNEHLVVDSQITPSIELQNWLKNSSSDANIQTLILRVTSLHPQEETQEAFFSTQLKPFSHVLSLLKEGSSIAKIYFETPKISSNLDDTSYRLIDFIHPEDSTILNQQYHLVPEALTSADIIKRAIHLNLSAFETQKNQILLAAEEKFLSSTLDILEKLPLNPLSSLEKIIASPVKIKELLPPASWSILSSLEASSETAKEFDHSVHSTVELEPALIELAKFILKFNLEDTHLSVEQSTDLALFDKVNIEIAKTLYGLSTPLLTKIHTSSQEYTELDIIALSPKKEFSQLPETFTTPEILFQFQLHKDHQKSGKFKIQQVSYSIQESTAVPKAEMQVSTLSPKDLAIELGIKELPFDIQPLDKDVDPLAESTNSLDPLLPSKSYAVEVETHLIQKHEFSPKLNQTEMGCSAQDLAVEKQKLNQKNSGIDLQNPSLNVKESDSLDFFAYLRAYRSSFTTHVMEKSLIIFAQCDIKTTQLKEFKAFSLHQQALFSPEKTLVSIEKHSINAFDHVAIAVKPVLELKDISYDSYLKVSQHRYFDELYRKYPDHYSTSIEKTSLDSSSICLSVIKNLPQIIEESSDFVSMLASNEQVFDPNEVIQIDKSNPSFDSSYRSLLRKKALDYLSLMPTLKDLHTHVMTHEFRNEVEVIASPDGESYYFSVKLIPYYPEDLRKMNQNVYFVIDQSRTISEERFEVFKKGILRSIPYLSSDATFNIIVLNKNCDVMSHVSLNNDKEAIEIAKNYLSKITYGFIVAPQDYSKVLSFIENKFSPDKNSINTVILLSDGSYYKNYHLDHDKIAEVCKTNHNLFQVYTVAASQDNYLGALDMIATHNHGELLYSKTNAALPRQLAILVKNLRNPIANNLYISTIRNESNTIEFFPSSGQLPAFFADHPLTIYGKTDRLQNIDLMIQGKVDDEWINISQSINLRQARHGDRELLRNCQMMEKKLRYFTEKVDHDET